MMRDPVCGREFGLREAGAMSIWQGRAYLFCCAACRERFAADPRQWEGLVGARRLAVGVMGAAEAGPGGAIEVSAAALGRTIAERGLQLVTGACPGLPLAAARGARAAGGLSVGISPALSLDEHIYRYGSPADAFDVLIYTGSGLMGREVTNIRSSDMVVILGGRSGTLGEFAIAYDEGKLIGVLEGSGGISSELPGIVRAVGKDTGAEVLYRAEPRALVDALILAYQERHFRRPSCFGGPVEAMPPPVEHLGTEPG